MSISTKLSWDGCVTHHCSLLFTLRRDHYSCVCVFVCVCEIHVTVRHCVLGTDRDVVDVFFVNVNKVHWRLYCLFHTESECVPVMVINYGTESVRDYCALCVPVMVSWGFGALLKGNSVVVLRVERDRWLFTPPTNNSCRYRDSNSQPLDYESDSLTIRPRLPLGITTWQYMKKMAIYF